MTDEQHTASADAVANQRSEAAKIRWAKHREREAADTASQSAPQTAATEPPAAAASGDSEVSKLRAELAELKALLAQATLQKIVTPPVSPMVLRRPEKPEPLIEMRVDDKGKGKIATGGVSGFERHQDYGTVFKTPLSSGRHLWNRNYATPVDRSIIPKWERENRREQMRTQSEKKKLDHLLDEAAYDEDSAFGNAA